MQNPNEQSDDSDGPGLKKNVNYHAPALEKGLDIIELLIDRRYGMAQAEICRALKRSRGELYRMMQVLEDRGYIYRVDRHDRYALTMKLYFLGQHHEPTRSFGTLISPILQQFALQTRQSCYLAAFDGDAMIVIATAGAEAEWNVTVRVGTRVPLNRSAAGESYLAYQYDESRIRLLQRDWEEIGSQNRSDIVGEVQVYQESGYICRPNERIPGITDIAVPVIDEGGAASAILVCPYLALSEEADVMSIKQISAALRETTQRIAATVDQRFLRSILEMPG
ncbi:IclR family transcriptional regulator [Burkholderia pyrrocinia]|uniref:IclR family transcriptional regulator n=1 Tax=Burkholderia pyrrocinia TaxID=60550 RepID=UPI002BADC378|nr:IclR family transcriptional regulator [Burkholderia sp.]